MMSDRLQELFEKNLVLLEPIIRQKLKERQRIISKSVNKCNSYLTRIDEENSKDSKDSKKI